MAQQPLVGQGLLIIQTSRSYSDTSHLVRLLCTSDRPDAETSTWQRTTLTRATWQRTTLTRDIFVPGGIRTSNPSKRAVANPRVRPLEHWDRRIALHRQSRPHLLPSKCSKSSVCLSRMLAQYCHTPALISIRTKFFVINCHLTFVTRCVLQKLPLALRAKIFPYNCSLLVNSGFSEQSLKQTDVK
jgi:hypothetical protein